MCSQVLIDPSQGTIIRRHRIPRQNAAGHFTVDDLNVGSTITLYARHFHIVSCDAFTRDFLSKTLKRQVPADTIAPEGEYEKHRKEILARYRDFLIMIRSQLSLWSE